jgi:hypothetical protein
VTPRLVSVLDARPEVVREAEIPPYTLYRVVSPGPGYVEPLAAAPVRSPLSGWRDRSFFWFSRKPENRAVLVFTDDPRFGAVAGDPWAAPLERPLDGGVEVREVVEAESIRITTSRPGHPLLVKVSYHPRWRAEGASGPYLASPGFMIVVPHQQEVLLRYAARAWSDWLGLGLALAGVLAAVCLRRSGAPGSGGKAPPERRGLAGVGAALPIALVVALAALRLLPEPTSAREIELLDEKASRAYAEERWADAGEYARGASSLLPATDVRRAGLLCLQGEALLRAGHAREAVEPFALVVEGAGPHRPQALYSGAVARERAGDAAGAEEWRRALREGHPATPWAEKLAASPPR